MTVKELKNELSKFDDNLPIKYVLGYMSSKDLDVSFKEEKVWSNSGDHLIKVLMMYGDY